MNKEEESEYSQCNKDCDYCYNYTHYDKSWSKECQSHCIKEGYEEGTCNFDGTCDSCLNDSYYGEKCESECLSECLDKKCE